MSSAISRCNDFHQRELYSDLNRLVLIVYYIIQGSYVVFLLLCVRLSVCLTAVQLKIW